MSDYIVTENGELCHYGVRGMKWGVRKGKVDKAYAKASKKLSKLDKKVEKTRRQWEKSASKADMYALRTSRKGAERRAKYEALAKQSAAKNAVYTRKAKKWLDSMDKVFKNTTVSLSNEQIALGKKYQETIDRRLTSRYYY